MSGSRPGWRDCLQRPRKAAPWSNQGGVARQNLLGRLTFGTRTILDASEDSPIALAELVEDRWIHSKASAFWNIEDVLPSQSWGM
jgi:hypothetical protein